MSRSLHERQQPWTERARHTREHWYRIRHPVLLCLLCPCSHHRHRLCLMPSLRAAVARQVALRCKPLATRLLYLAVLLLVLLSAFLAPSVLRHPVGFTFALIRLYGLWYLLIHWLRKLAFYSPSITRAFFGIFSISFIFSLSLCSLPPQLVICTTNTLHSPSIFVGIIRNYRQTYLCRSYPTTIPCIASCSRGMGETAVCATHRDRVDSWAGTLEATWHRWQQLIVVRADARSFHVDSSANDVLPNSALIIRCVAVFLLSSPRLHQLTTACRGLSTQRATEVDNVCVKDQTSFRIYQPLLRQIRRLGHQAEHPPRLYLAHHGQSSQ